MSEDRHSFSEPRPVPGLELPTWDVDVFRDGVEEPIMTLRVDNNLLPPRKGKKKKVAWKLPDTVDQAPRFGVDEKRRLLEIFKNIKKERRKAKTMQQLSGDSTSSEQAGEEQNEGRTRAQNGGTIDNNQGGPADKKTQQNNGSKSESVNGSNTQKSNQTQKTSDSDQATAGMERLSLASSERNNQAKPPPGLAPITTPAPAHRPPPGMMARVQSMPLESNEATNNSKNNAATAAAARAPPGMARSQSMPLESEEPRPPPPPPGIAASSSNPNLTQQQTQQPGSTNPPLQVPLLAPSRFFGFPAAMPQDVFAQHVANTYIALLQNGQVDELLMYYSLTAQKSLSLKSAHSMCATPNDMKRQLQSLVGCPFVVHGIALQRGINWIMLVWSGLCQVAGKTHGYTHTLVLVPEPASGAVAAPASALGGLAPTDNPTKYQIQNDALVLLATE